MLSTRCRKTVLTAVALVASTALLTACQGGDGGSDGKAAGRTQSDVKDSDVKDSDVEKPDVEDSDGAASSPEDAQAKSGGEGQDGDAEARSGSGGAGGKRVNGKGVSGTWFGNVSYMAPGKYTVSDMKGKQQAFFTSTGTDIQGAGEICGDAEGQAATKCTEAQLESAAKNGVSATVELKNGTAVSIVEDH